LIFHSSVPFFLFPATRRREVAANFIACRQSFGFGKRPGKPENNLRRASKTNGRGRRWSARAAGGLFAGPRVMRLTKSAQTANLKSAGSFYSLKSGVEAVPIFSGWATGRPLTLNEISATKKRNHLFFITKARLTRLVFAQPPLPEEARPAGRVWSLMWSNF